MHIFLLKTSSQTYIMWHLFTMSGGFFSVTEIEHLVYWIDGVVRRPAFKSGLRMRITMSN